MRPRLNLVNPLGGRPVQLVCKTDTITKIFTENILESKVLETKENVILTTIDNEPIWINEKDNSIESIVLHYNPIVSPVKGRKEPSEHNTINVYTIEKHGKIFINFSSLPTSFNTMPTNSLSNRLKRGAEIRKAIRHSLVSKTQIDSARELNIADKFMTELEAIQGTHYTKEIMYKRRKKLNKIKVELTLKEKINAI